MPEDDLPRQIAARCPRAWRCDLLLKCAFLRLIRVLQGTLAHVRYPSSLFTCAEGGRIDMLETPPVNACDAARKALHCTVGIVPTTLSGIYMQQPYCPTCQALASSSVSRLDRL